MFVCCFFFVLCFSLGQLITMAGLDKSTMPFSAAKPSDKYINGQSRHDATQQMRSILEHSRLDESILSADIPPVIYAARNRKPPTDPTQQLTHDQLSLGKNGSKFDELFQQAVRNADSILSDPDGHITLRDLYSPARSAPSENNSELDVSAARPDSRPPSKSLELSKSVESGHRILAVPDTPNGVGRPSDTVQGSQRSDVPDSVTSARSQIANKSADSGRVDETLLSAEYTTEEDEIEEIIESQ